MPLEIRHVNVQISLSLLSPLRVTVLASLTALSACSTVENLISGERIDYRGQSSKLPELDVPPDLSQLARDGRYQPQASVVSANAIAQQAKQPGANSSAVPLIAGNTLGDSRIERLGNTRWLTTSRTPEQLWPLLHNFWEERGFTIDTESQEAGVMETDWAENRAKLPTDIVRRTVGKVADLLFSSNTRDRFRTRLERGPNGTEIYISHRGIEEVLAGQFKDATKWQSRANDPELEAEMLSRLMVRLGSNATQATAAVAAATVKPTPAGGPAARAATVLPESATLGIAEGFDRAWRQVGLALDRSGFTVEDRDRGAGLYFVRYADPTQAGKEEPNFFSKLFSRDKDTSGVLRYRVAVKATGPGATVTVQDGKGALDNSENARRIVARLQEELRR